MFPCCPTRVFFNTSMYFYNGYTIHRKGENILALDGKRNASALGFDIRNN